MATIALQDSDFIDCGEKRRTLLGAKTIGQYIVAIAGWSGCKNRINLYFSVVAPGLVS